jgi:hypothetical protein
MDEYKIVKQFTKFVYPFKYTKNDSQQCLNRTIASFKGNTMHVWERCGIDGHELREVIADFFSIEEECSARIATCYRLNINCRFAFNLPPKAKEALAFTGRSNKEHKHKVAITDVCLYLFETEVGFAEITCEYESQSINDYIDCNYFISEIKSDKNVFEFTKRISETQDDKIKFTLKELLQQILADIDGVKYFDGIGKEFCEKKPIIYSYLLLNGQLPKLALEDLDNKLDETPDDLQAVLFLARKNYKGSYKLPLSEYSIEENPYIYQTFKNSFWAASLNGVVNVSFLVGDPKTDVFFTDNFPHKLYESSYYHLFLSTLHQKYAMRHLSGKMGCLGKIVKDRPTIDQLKNAQECNLVNEQLKAAKAYRDQAALLKFRAFFKIPSNIEHINNYYDLVNRTYEIGTIYNNFNEDINSIISLCESVILEKKELDDEEQEKKNVVANKKHEFHKTLIEAVFATFAPLFGIIVVMKPALDIIEKAFIERSFIEKLFGQTLPFTSHQIIGTLLVVSVVVGFVAAILYGYKYIADLIHLSKSKKSAKEALAKYYAERKLKV